MHHASQPVGLTPSSRHDFLEEADRTESPLSVRDSHPHPTQNGRGARGPVCNEQRRLQRLPVHLAGSSPGPAPQRGSPHCQHPVTAGAREGHGAQRLARGIWHCRGHTAGRWACAALSTEDMSPLSPHLAFPKREDPSLTPALTSVLTVVTRADTFCQFSSGTFSALLPSQ